MLDELWGQLKRSWNALPKWLSITIANTVHQMAHLALMFVDGIKNSFVGHGILVSLGWSITSTNYLHANNAISVTPTYYAATNINYLGFLDIMSEVVEILIIGVPYCGALIIWYSFISPRNTLACRNKWLTHALLSMLPLSIICAGSSALGAIILGGNGLEAAHSATASVIGTWVFSIPTTILTIFSFKQFCGIYKRHSEGHLAAPTNTNLIKRLKNNALHEVINIGILYGIGITGSLIGLAILYPISKFEPILFLNTFLGDITGISVIVIPLGVFYCSINTFIQKKDALTERPARARHSALRLGPTSIGMPIMTLLGTYICFGNNNLSIVTAGNAIGILIISAGVCAVMTVTNQITKRLNRQAQPATQTENDENTWAATIIPIPATEHRIPPAVFMMPPEFQLNNIFIPPFLSVVPTAPPRQTYMCWPSPGVPYFMSSSRQNRCYRYYIEHIPAPVSTFDVITPIPAGVLRLWPPIPSPPPLVPMLPAPGGGASAIQIYQS